MDQPFPNSLSVISSENSDLNAFTIDVHVPAICWRACINNANGFVPCRRRAETAGGRVSLWSAADETVMMSPHFLRNASSVMRTTLAGTSSAGSSTTPHANAAADM